VITVDFNPQNAVPEVLGMIVAAPTGVLYGNQCGGLACLYKSVEGYLVVAGRATAFIDFFARFDGRPPAGPADWAAQDLAHLKRMVQEQVFYFVPDGSADTRVPLTLDPANLPDLTEAWIPVRVGDDAAVLVFANSD